MILKLQEIVYDKRAKDGTWCTLEYYNHPNGCPNFPDCPEEHEDFENLPEMQWWAIIHPFDLKAREEEYLKKEWCKTKRQARCVLYWQNRHMKKLKEISENFKNKINGDIILEIPEANGVNVYATMAKSGFELKAVNLELDIVYKIMLVGKCV